MLTVKVVIFFQLVNIVYGLSFLPSDGLKVVYDRWDGMCGSRKLPIKSLYRISQHYDRVIYLNVTMTVKEDIDESLVLNMKMRRCHSKENLDTCEDFIEQTGLNYCGLIDPTIGRLSPMYVNYVPQFKCPARKGVYKAYNSKIDISLIIGFPLNDYYWRGIVHITTAQTNRYVQCLEVDGYVTKNRSTTKN